VTINNEESNSNKPAKKAGRVTKRLVNISVLGAKKASQLPKKTVEASKKGVESFKQGYNESK